MAGQWLQPDHAIGDANTIGGYMKAHARPAAFEGSDGLSYSVAIETDATGDAVRPYAAYFLFLRWRRIGAQGVDGHLESEYLCHGPTREGAREALGTWSLSDVRAQLEQQIVAVSSGGGAGAPRRWWDVMKDET
ncbi:MAG: hypothetical protein ABI910_10225 [Gemmatimonadota bacterium]